MKNKFLQTIRVPSLIVAAALQVLPLARAALPAAGAASNVLAILFRWAVGAAALGTVDAVSGATTVITSPLSTNIVQGKTITIQLATALRVAYYWSSTVLPPGLSLSGTGGSPAWQITGTPTSNGTFNVVLYASEYSTFPADRTISGIMTFKIAPPAGSQPRVTAPPTGLAVAEGQSATFSVSASGLAPFSYQWQLNGFELSGQTGTNLVISPVTTNDAGSYTVVITNVAGSVTSSPASLVVITPPVITTQPQSQSNLYGANLLFSVAADSAGPLTYQWRKDGVALTSSPHLTGTQSSLFRLNFALTTDSGDYSVIVSNAAGSVTSQVATVTVAPVFSPITVLVNGQGSVSPNYNGQSLQIGATYTLAAAPGDGYYFTNWTGSFKSTASAITFVMQSNLVLTANFLFPFVKGVYRGLCYDPNGVTVSNSGAFTLTTTPAGKYSGSLVLAGKKFALAGKFNILGNASNQITLSQSNVALVSLAIDPLDKDRLTGSVSNAFWSVPLSGDRATFSATLNPAPQHGYYTLVIPGVAGSTSDPAGNSYGTLKVDAAGNATFAGSLADGTKVSQATVISKNGSWPLYAPLYSGNGLVLGWQNFTNAPTDDVSGPVCWIKTAQPNARYYPAGFALMPLLSGSAYVPPSAGAPVLNLQFGDLMLTDGGLSQAYTNLITILPNSKATNIAGVKLTLSFTPKTGLFTGNFINPESAKKVSLSGVILQKQNLGAGYFLSTNLSGQVLF